MKLLNTKSKHSAHQSGFTLIELLVASTIMIVLTAIGLVSFAASGKSARNAKRKADLETIRQAAVLYRSDMGEYPEGDYNTAAGTMAGAGYLSYPIPHDPRVDQTGTDYNYSPAPAVNPTTFCLCVLTEGDAQGNATDLSCSFGTGSGAVYHCVKNP